jgi:hypothetical protein
MNSQIAHEYMGGGELHRVPTDAQGLVPDEEVLEHVGEHD